MRLNKLINEMMSVGVKVVNRDMNYKTIYKGSTTGVKRKFKDFENYEITTIFSSVEPDCDLDIYVKEVK